MTLNNREHIISTAKVSMKWSVLNNFFPRLITPVTTTILAALLTPENFGVVAISSVIVAFAQIVIGMGWGPAIVQRRDQVDESAAVAFWLSFGVACMAYMLLWIAAPLLARAFSSSDLVDILRLSGTSFFLHAMSSIPLALLQRDMEFRALFMATALPMILSNIISVIWALSGGGVWALVLGPLMGLAYKTAVVLHMAKWRPSFDVQWGLLPELLGFSAWVMVGGLQTWLFLYVDNLIAGLHFGPDSLGIYSLGYNLANLLPGMIISSLSSVAYPSFCALENLAAVGKDLVKVQRLAAALLFPLCFGIAIVAPPAITLLYGAKWDGLGHVIQWLVIAPGAITLWSLNADAYRAANRPDLWTKIAAVNLAILLPMLLFSGSLGLLGYTAMRFLGALPLIILNMVVMQRVLNVNFRQQISALVSPALGSLIMFIVGILVTRAAAPFTGLIGWAMLLGIILVCAVLYMAIIWILDRPLFVAVFNNMQSTIRFSPR